ncbi:MULTISPECIES: GntR family transcriptional regulator [Saccharopolyspora]|uniref:GntR family transcriptional regulator n=1 Tax=Saccharopolyspora gregorii TaxID=33914 RepID=A0ABP6RYS7_9PSEU|nr:MULTISPECIES: GntR family transcriptional regulator [Saccharopolyspora]MCA1189988.1 GntR family transcriptional regulator [Saccharopolyspora sp. 6T]MCA1194766.1 GntR family transcriptional regulator [Saccharopolyspora sp. 6V]MCA1228519.1 GntR family transcriptional regulator [Saccharopolyspora sp. 6M]MCA1283359.1 GntR family transcriptional regulator [Saccharopolyspora sp. 7B]
MLETSVSGGADTPVRAQREPKYWGLKQHLLDMLRSLPPGSPIPTERALAAEFDVSRTTVRQALAELTVEGRLLRVQGKGTFAAKPKVAQRLQLSSYTEDMRAQGRQPASRLLEVVEEPADQELATLLGTRPGSAALRLRRLRLADGEPMAIETTHLPLSRFRGLTGRLESGGSLYRVLREHFGVELGHADETIETALASPEEAETLGADVGLPMLLLSRHSFDSAGEPVEWVRSIYRGDRYKFVARLNPPQ